MCCPVSSLPTSSTSTDAIFTCRPQVSPPGPDGTPAGVPARALVRDRPRRSGRDEIACRGHHVLATRHPCFLEGAHVGDRGLCRGQKPRWRVEALEMARGLRAISEAPHPPPGGPSWTTRRRAVRTRLSATAMSSKGTRVRGSMTSISMPSAASRSAASSARWRICWVATTVTSLPAGRARPLQGGRDPRGWCPSALTSSCARRPARGCRRAQRPVAGRSSLRPCRARYGIRARSRVAGQRDSHCGRRGIGAWNSFYDAHAVHCSGSHRRKTGRCGERHFLLRHRAVRDDGAPCVRWRRRPFHCRRVDASSAGRPPATRRWIVWWLYAWPKTRSAAAADQKVILALKTWNMAARQAEQAAPRRHSPRSGAAVPNRET